MRSTTLEKYKATLELTPLQREVLVGLILGDGHIEQPYKTPRARLKVMQSENAKEFVEWIYNIFQKWARSGIKRKVVTLSKTGKQYGQLWFNTISHEHFYIYRKMFYPEGKKRIPENIKELITPLSFAVWFMGDGSIKSHESRGRILNTHCFSLQEVEVLSQILKDKFQLNAWPRKQREGFQIYISGDSAGKLQRILEKHIIPSMRYKLPLHSR